jgi:hypothetical protein
MTTLETVKTELELAGILNMYCNEPLIKSIYNLVIRSLHFGIEEIENSNLGVITKQIARNLHFKDGRKSVYCEVTCKNILK